MAKPTDKEVSELARRLAKAGAGSKSSVYSMSFWNEKLLEWAMSRPEFKAQLFRLVDVFPATTDSQDILDHVGEYLSGPDVPRALRAAIDVAEAVPLGATVTASQARRNVERMAKQFILGSETSEAVSGAKQLWETGSGAVIDLLGEKTVAESEADIYADRIGEMLDALIESSKDWKPQQVLDNDDSGALPRVQISIKPTALATKYKPLTHEAGLAQAKKRLRPLLRKCLDGSALIWFDMEHYDVKDMTLRLFRDLLSEEEFKDMPAGIVLQAYLRDTYDDLADIVRWSATRSTPVSVRLVKGAYWDTEKIIAEANDWQIPVFVNKPESDANYERCTRLLIDHHGEVKAAFASHNLRSLAYAVSYARANDLRDNAIEVQMLYGMAEPMHEAVRKEGLRLRVYSPVGAVVPGMAYLVRRLLENTSNESFVRLRFADNKKIDELIAAPKVDTLPGPTSVETRNATNAEAPSAYLPEPPAEWHRYSVRHNMTQQMGAKTNSGAPSYVPGVINGERIRTDDGIDSVNPADTGDVVATSARCSVDDVEHAISIAKVAQRKWASLPVVERARVLFGAADWMRKRRFELTALEVREACKPWADADGDVCEAIDFCEYYAREALRLDAGGPVQSPSGEVNALRYEARGVGAVIAPWNFPLAIPTGMTTAALVTGNAVLLKPAEQTPLIASKLVEALEHAGLPNGVLAFLPGDGEVVGSAMVKHRDTAFVAFTGSKPVGLSIVEDAAKIQPGQSHIKKVIVELGGKNPMIIDSDADLDQVVPAVMYSAFGYAGQKCSALSRLIVDSSVSDQLHERIVGALSEMKIGDPRAMDVEIPAVIDADAQRRIASVVRAAPSMGDVLASRQDLPEGGYFVAPTVVTGVDPASSLAKNEVFGPVLATFNASDIDEALELANDTEFGLTAGLFSRSPSVIERVTRSIRASNIYVNRQMTGSIVGRQPFGGIGLSGGGTKAGGPDYLLNFVEPRVITENTVRQGFADLT